jgi:hypothetical protein
MPVGKRDMCGKLGKLRHTVILEVGHRLLKIPFFYSDVTEMSISVMYRQLRMSLCQNLCAVSYVEHISSNTVSGKSK